MEVCLTNKFSSTNFLRTNHHRLGEFSLADDTQKLRHCHRENSQGNFKLRRCFACLWSTSKLKLRLARDENVFNPHRSFDLTKLDRFCVGERAANI